ncbi:receptor-like protein EIX2 [Cajanus cajan]|uniref:receptor-like protein EIX2 n=1 Tax=Cajanus cajan TaxID=3821 RepID=UPI0010FB5437|nr:receptor-like protein EIX2 [Cajanus cajan]
MSRYFLKVFYALLFLLLHSSGLKIAAEVKCIERERQALLNFKQSLFDDSGILSTWRDGDNNTDCCKWRGIQCHNETGHVRMLHLPGSHTQYLKGVINLTSLIDLHNIQHLDLSYNNFLVSHLPEELMGSLANLTYLNLSYSVFSGMIPSTLGNLSQLQYLDLGGNYLCGVIPFQIGNLSQLKYLDLGYNALSGEIPYQIGNLKQLQFLSLSGGIPFQAGNIPLLHTLGLGGNFDLQDKDAEWFSNLSSLTTLQLTSLHNLSASRRLLQTISKFIPNLRQMSLVDCSLSDADIRSLFYSHSNFSTSLTILGLSSNLLTSSTFHLLSSLLPNFPSLKILDLSYNNLSSSIFQGNFNFGSKLKELHLENCSLTDRSFTVSSTSTMNSSSSLLYLDLSNNLLKSFAIFHWLFNFTTGLNTLCLNHNLLEGPIPDVCGKTMNSLEVIDLSYNKLQGKIPSFFGNMCRLQSLYLSNNKLNGKISSFFQNSSWCNRHVFQNLYLSYNQITGKIPKSITLLSELEQLSLGSNSLEGDVTESHLSNFSKLEYLSLSQNSLSVKLVPSWIPPFRLSYLGVGSCKLGPSFPSWLQTQSSLIYLDISDNGLNGSVPEWFWNMQFFYSLNMSHNNLTGTIPNIPLELHAVPSIILNSNQFEGSVPSFLRQASELLLSENKFSDLSSFLCDQRTVAKFGILDLSKNQIKGQLPDCWKSVDQLLFLDLSNNQLSGKIPISMGTLVKLEALILGGNSLMGELPSTLKNCSNLFVLDVEENLLSGPIPSWIGGSMQQLIILIMRGNHFSGNLPVQLCSLRHIQMLDLSRNKLSKGIPTCIKNFIAMSEKSINKSETYSRIYEYDITYYDFYGPFSFDDYKLDITWMWKGLEQQFKDPELNLNSIDLSCNNLTGKIPREIGYLLGLVSLNLSRNNLSGEIPFEIGYLSSLDFLDLSRNHFCGRIPSSLTQIDGLGKLDLSHNSLSGRIPSGRHFETYGASIFEGNNDLCGEQVNKSCPGDETIVKPQEQAVHEEDSVFYEALYMSLGIGYFVGFWGLIGTILIWKPWRIAYTRCLNRITNWVTV